MKIQHVDLIKSLGSLGPDLLKDQNIKDRFARLFKAFYGNSVTVDQYREEATHLDVYAGDPEVVRDILSKFVYSNMPVLAFDLSKAKEIFEKLQASPAEEYRIILENSHMYVVLLNQDVALKLKLSV